MRILIVSDTHGAHGYLDDALEQIGEIDMFIHLGDLMVGTKHIDRTVKCEKHIVAGNGDRFPLVSKDIPKESEFMIGSNRVFITHGHKYLTMWGAREEEGIIEEGRSRGVDIVMFGHSHKPFLEILPDITALNPGSISYPRQDNGKPSFILMEIGEDKEINYSIYYREKSGEFVC